MHPIAIDQDTSAKPRYRIRQVSQRKGLMVMEKARATAGLPADHLCLCPDCRAPAEAWEKRPLP